PIEKSRFGQALAYDAARERVVLFGGSDTSGYFGDTWTWDGQQWTEEHPAVSPPARQNFAMTYDASRRMVIAFGGYGEAERLDDTWGWDGTTWSPISTPHAPRARYDHTMA